jgi:hypothetical protein
MSVDAAQQLTGIAQQQVSTPIPNSAVSRAKAPRGFAPRVPRIRMASGLAE